jgi:hypothetical protein
MSFALTMVFRCLIVNQQGNYVGTLKDASMYTVCSVLFAFRSDIIKLYIYWFASVTVHSSLHFRSVYRSHYKNKQHGRHFLLVVVSGAKLSHK